MNQIRSIFITYGSRAAALACLCLGLGLGLPVRADTPAAALDATRQWVDTALGAQGNAELGGLRMEVVLGNLDTRLQLATCARIEPYLPAGSRLWGKTRIGLRCVEGAVHWNVFLPVTVKAWGQAWVLKSGAVPGASLNESDAMQAEVDWAADNSPVLARLDQWVGQHLAYPVAAGMPLRQSMIRPAQAFAAGAPVRITAQGAGFQISTQGQSVGPGVLGQSVRVKTEAGTVLTGTVLDAHTVVVNY